MRVRVAHALPQAEAMRRIRSLLSEVRSQHCEDIDRIHEQWTDTEGAFELVVRGWPVNGQIAVGASEVTVSADLPLVARFFQGQIVQTIQDRGEQLLA